MPLGSVYVKADITTVSYAACTGGRLSRQVPLHEAQVGNSMEATPEIGITLSNLEGIEQSKKDRP